jgi:hypothetical protein
VLCENITCLMVQNYTVVIRGQIFKVDFSESV